MESCTNWRENQMNNVLRKYTAIYIPYYSGITIRIPSLFQWPTWSFSFASSIYLVFSRYGQKKRFNSFCIGNLLIRKIDCLTSRRYGSNYGKLYSLLLKDIIWVTAQICAEVKHVKNKCCNRYFKLKM